MEASLSPTPQIPLREAVVTDRHRRRSREFADTGRAVSLLDDPAAGIVDVPDIEPRSRSEIATRAVNCLIAVLLLVVTSPILVLAAIAIKCTSPGPIFYMQPRVGLDRRRRAAARRDDDERAYDRRGHNLGGRVFKIYKLRTMRSDAERQSGVVWARRQDPRTTSVGRVLRKCRIDEIPQLVNVLKGEMNIVGPRPERPSLVAKLSRGIPEYPLRQLARPGITGWAQVNQAYDSCLDDVRSKVTFDLEYLRRQSVMEDLRIMFRTVPVVLFRRNGW